MKLFSVDFDLFGTAYIKAETSEEALEKFHTELRGSCLDLPEDNFVTGADYAAIMDPERNFPDVTMSPSVTVDTDQIFCEDDLEQVWSDEPEEADKEAEHDYVQLAKERFSRDDIEIEDDAELSHSKDGTWVAAWVLVPQLEGE